MRPFFKSCGKNFRVGRNVTFYNPSKLIVGNNVYIAFGCWLSSGGGINIEDEVTIGPYCSITSASHKRVNNSYFNTGATYDRVVIGKGSWIGAQCVITSGCTLGTGCVLGAGAVCLDDVPKDSLAAGVPAKVIKQIGQA
ncbi:MAG: acyltransferase [Candidatus Helarchaeota archaeon]